MTAPSMPLIVDLTTAFDNAKQEIAPTRTFTRTNSSGHHTFKVLVQGQLESDPPYAMPLRAFTQQQGIE